MQREQRAKDFRGAFHKRFGGQAFPQIGYFITNFGGSFTPKLFCETHPRNRCGMPSEPPVLLGWNLTIYVYLEIRWLTVWWLTVVSTVIAENRLQNC